MLKFQGLLLSEQNKCFKKNPLKEKSVQMNWELFGRMKATSMLAIPYSFGG